MFIPLRALVLTWTATFAAAASAVENAADTRHELEGVRAQLETEKKRLVETETQLGSTQSALKEVETEIGRATATSRRLERELRAAAKQLEKLNASGDRLEQKNKRQRDILAREMTAQFLRRGDDTLHLWLGDTDTLRMGQVLAFHHYVSAARTEHIAQTKQALDAVEQNRRQIAEKQRELAALSKQQTDAMRELERHRTQRQTILASLTESAARSRSTVAELEGNAQRLEELLTRLRQTESKRRPTTVSSAPTLLPRSEPFAQRKGLLPWPVSGKIVQRFGATRQNSTAKYRGVMIDAAAGQAVRAIAPGRVVFAEWLRGFGLLLILDHGDGFFSLYGHNEALLRDVGDHVDELQEIATVGASGGQITSGLYFEIRHKGKPVNPSQWCNDRG